MKQLSLGLDYRIKSTFIQQEMDFTSVHASIYNGLESLEAGDQLTHKSTWEFEKPLPEHRFECGSTDVAKSAKRTPHTLCYVIAVAVV